MPAPDTPRMDRREAIKWMMTAAAGLMLTRHPVFGDTAASAAAAPSGHGYGTDPDLTKTYNPGELWPLTLTPAQRRTATALCDVIIPADATSGAASSVGVPDFIDEWVSAPYDQQVQDRPLILEGLTWIEAESQKRFGTTFAEATSAQQHAICDDICHEPAAKPEHKPAAKFFNRYRELTMGGFYTTPIGMKDVGYIGNVPLVTFDGPPPDLLAKLDLA